jgi:hypothetical protein
MAEGDDKSLITGIVNDIVSSIDHVASAPAA